MDMISNPLVFAFTLMLNTLHQTLVRNVDVRGTITMTDGKYLLLSDLLK